ncbi:Ig-like domain repeat protein [Granulicella rosea]|nr:Ig-like domain repeat protein [Granulicella rosea]
MVVSACFAPLGAQTTAPYLLPYTINTIAGGGTAPAAKASCPAGNGTTALAVDTFGDGCLASSSSVVDNTDLHDVGVDGQGNIYYIDNGSTGVIRRIDARTGLVTVYAGSYGSSTTSCTTQVDKYGDGCLANDNNTVPATSGNLPGGNANGGYTLGLVKGRGISVTKNGDVYFADYSGNLIHKISASTGIMSILVGVVSGTSAKSASATSGYAGDGGPSTAAKEFAARGVAADASGNVYIADSSNNVVRMVSGSTGIITTYAGINPGTGSAAASGFSGDGGPATSAVFATPEDVEVDANGNVFVGDFGNNRVRVIYQGGATVAKLIALTNGGAVAQAGYIYTVVGSSSTTAYVAGTQVLATSSAIGNPRKLTLDARGNIYVADNSYNVIWFVDATTGYMRPIAGLYNVPSSATAVGVCSTKSNTIGDGCPATQATLLSNSAMGVAVDGLGNVLISDSGDARLRKVFTNQSFGSVAAGASLAQTLQVHFGAGDNAAAANAFTITGNTDFTVTSSTCTTNTDTTTDCLVVVTYKPTAPGAEKALLTATSLLGQSAAFGVSGVGTVAALAIDPGTTASLSTTLKTPFAIAQDSAGNTYIADTGNNRVVRYSISGTATVIAGTGTAGYGGDGAVATLATLSAPKGVAVARSGAIFIADTGNNVIRRIDPVTGFISTYGGTTGAVCTAATDTFGDGCLGTAAKFSSPTGVAADNDGNIYIADTGDNLIRELSVSGYASLIAGGGTVCTANLLGTTKTPDSLGNNCFGPASTFNGPTGIAVDAGKNLYIADTGNNEIREIVAATGYVTLIGGNGQAGFSGDGGTATGAKVNGPTGITVDAAGDVYIADAGNSAIRFINASGNMSTVVGTLNNAGTGTLPGLATAVLLSSPAGVVSNGAGTLTVLDSGNNRAFNVARGSLAYTFARTVPGTTSATLAIQETSTGAASVLLSPTTTTSIFTSTGSTGSFTLGGSTSGTCSADQTLAPASTCTLTAQFAPTALGAVSATYTESATTPALSPAPTFSLSGTGATLTKTTSTTTVTVPATGNPQYAVSFTLQTTVVPASCNTAAPSCIPTGTVAYYVNGTQVGVASTVSATGVATAVIGGQSVGTISVVAVYSGDGYYAASTAATLPVIISQGTSVTTVTATPSPVYQFASLVLKATVKSASTSDIPTGKVGFYAGTTLLGTATLANGVASISDATNSFGLAAGTYQLQAQYQGDQNYATSTSTITLVITADVASFSLAYNGVGGVGSSSAQAGAAAVGTAQGSTSVEELVVTPTNTLSGAMTFACSGMPVNSVCTFSPTSLTFTPTALTPAYQLVQVTLWTDIAPGTNPAQTTGMNVRPARSSKAALATVLGWPMLMLSLAGMFGFRKRMRHSNLFTAVALFGLLAGSSVVMTGCFNAKAGANLTPTGVYNVTITATGPQSTSANIPVTFTVSKGIAGQE